MGYISKMRYTTDVIYQAKNYVVCALCHSHVKYNEMY